MTGIESIRELERVGYRAPLALRCVDGVSGIEVADALLATAWRRSDPATSRTASRSPLSGLLGFGSLPGLWSAERARSDPGQPLTWPARTPVPYCARIVDTARRYLTAVVSVEVPVSGPLVVPLSSAPGRPMPSGWAGVRGEVHRATALGGAGPLPWSVVQIDTGPAQYSAVADSMGRFLLYLPYPEALPPLLGSIPLGGGIGTVTWPLTISVRCQPGALEQAPGSGPQDPPDLGSINAQAVAQIDDGTGPQPSVDQTLTFGTLLMVRLDVIPA